MMKKFAIALLCALPCTTFAADWTPVFKPWESCVVSDVVEKMVDSVQAAYDSDLKYYKALDRADQNWRGEWRDYDNPRYRAHLKKYGADLNLLVSKNALQGKYPTIPAQYRKDMGKAYITAENPTMFRVAIPLSNAKLYGLPIKEYVMVFGQESDGISDYVVFDKISNAQYEKLKKIKMKTVYIEAAEAPDYYTASIYRDEETGEVIFSSC